MPINYLELKPQVTEYCRQAHDRIFGQLSGERVAPLTSGMIRSGQVTVDVWIGQDDAYVRRIEIVELDSDPEDPTHWHIEFTAFDQPVDIEAPSLP